MNGDWSATACEAVIVRDNVVRHVVEAEAIAEETHHGRPESHWCTLSDERRFAGISTPHRPPPKNLFAVQRLCCSAAVPCCDKLEAVAVAVAVRVAPAVMDARRPRNSEERRGRVFYKGNREKSGWWCDY